MSERDQPLASFSSATAFADLAKRLFPEPKPGMTEDEREAAKILDEALHAAADHFREIESHPGFPVLLRLLEEARLKMLDVSIVGPTLSQAGYARMTGIVEGLASLPLAMRGLTGESVRRLRQAADIEAAANTEI